jgi:hypothetical protein
MITSPDRRTFLRLGITALASNVVVGRAGVGGSETTPHFPLQDPALVREMVLVAHGNVERVKSLLAARPALARAAIDWGYGDWEDALGAASHVGSRRIAEMLIASGARPSIFSAAMLGQLDVVRAFVASSPGIQRTLGPHSITLLAHARAGGEGASHVVDYLRDVGGADSPPPEVPLDDHARDRYLGTYSFGTDPSQRLVIGLAAGVLTIQRPGGAYRIIRHLGSHEFYPVGAEAVRIRFAVSGSSGPARAVAVYDPDLLVTATRSVR